MLTADIIKKRIEAAGDSVPEAAAKLGMSKQNLYAHLSKVPLSSHFIRQFNETYKESSNIDHINEPGVPYYPVDVAASNVDVFNDQPELSTIRIQVPGFEDCELAVPVFGHSMYPTYENGCIIICKRIKDMDVISYGEVHLIITAEQRLLKRVKRSSEKDSILLVSDNYEAQKENKLRYEPFDLPKKKIRHLFIVKGSIKRNQI